MWINIINFLEMIHAFCQDYLCRQNRSRAKLLKVIQVKYLLLLFFFFESNGDGTKANTAALFEQSNSKKRSQNVEHLFLQKQMIALKSFNALTLILKHYISHLINIKQNTINESIISPKLLLTQVLIVQSFVSINSFFTSIDLVKKDPKCYCNTLLKESPFGQIVCSIVIFEENKLIFIRKNDKKVSLSFEYIFLQRSDANFIVYKQDFCFLLEPDTLYQVQQTIGRLFLSFIYISKSQNVFFEIARKIAKTSLTKQVANDQITKKNHLLVCKIC
ncbi:hypothetical protein RFI_06210 [Reticulomyxa filosa]|uniref:Uncharacterized protein n=1 Tax=Reticulomyxa filosa TaxID=46433 RepID=X6NYK2_RETFI|nr:hypothetical protein RFI_06210 [Reticulomyxa filosa]|eukprot:ETO30909.1 hypothetical protein RFI_06210 [Reticulomyxa filosa]